MKELDLLIAVSRISHEARSVDDLLEQVVRAVPGGWQFPEWTAARIVLDTRVVQTPNYLETQWRQEAEVPIRNAAAGQISVTYLKEFPDAAEGPFLAEERRLIESVASAVGGGLARLERERRLQAMLMEDPLTGLLTRRGLTIRVMERMRVKPDVPFGYFVLDVDRLWEINNKFGFGVGNQVLSGLAQRFRQHFEGLAGREGRRFVFVLDDISAEGLRAFVEERLIPAFNEPFSFPDMPASVIVAFEIAAAHYPSHANDPSAVSQLADAAMSRAKQGQRRFVIVDPELDGPQRYALDTVSRVRAGVAAREFILHYQPQVSRSGSVDAVEALLRWNRDGRLVMPSEFIEVVESYGLLAELLTPIVCFLAFNQAATWDALGRPIRVAINLSPTALMAEKLVEIVTFAIRQAGIAATQVEVEVTESAIMSDLDRASATLTELRSLGFRVALDDFGTGYSSLSLLRRLPVDTVKVDRSFVRSVLTSASDAVIVQSIIDMAHAVGAEVVAEGVEDQATANWLWSRGVEYIQGYLFARPMHPDEILGWQPQPGEFPGA